LTAPPDTWKTCPVMPWASSAHSATTIFELFAGCIVSKPSSGAANRSPSRSSVIRVRAFGATQLTVTP